MPSAQGFQERNSRDSRVLSGFQARNARTPYRVPKGEQKTEGPQGALTALRGSTKALTRWPGTFRDSENGISLASSPQVNQIGNRGQLLPPGLLCEAKALPTVA